MAVKARIGNEASGTLPQIWDNRIGAPALETAFQDRTQDGSLRLAAAGRRRAYPQGFLVQGEVGPSAAIRRNAP
ncbi:MAG: hypothetical protein KGS44_15330, partial [Alphaproteobacteria bacterium]|nr:hypothetical protein [Alphaproteobacteria bacterium]